MNKVQIHIISTLAEEACEVGQEVSKAIRFGLDAVRPADGSTPRSRLINELNDILGTAQLLVDQGVLPSDWQDQSKQDAKALKVVKFMNSHGVIK